MNWSETAHLGNCGVPARWTLKMIGRRSLISTSSAASALLPNTGAEAGVPVPTAGVR
jgi:hypothetical protein